MVKINKNGCCWISYTLLSQPPIKQINILKTDSITVLQNCKNEALMLIPFTTRTNYHAGMHVLNHRTRKVGTNQGTNNKNPHQKQVNSTLQTMIIQDWKCMMVSKNVPSFPWCLHSNTDQGSLLHHRFHYPISPLVFLSLFYHSPNLKSRLFSSCTIFLALCKAILSI